MKEVIIRYNDSKTLALLRALAKILNFSIATPTKSQKVHDQINGVPVIPGDNSISVKELSKIFTGKNLNARKLRTQEWQRQK